MSDEIGTEDEVCKCDAKPDEAATPSSSTNTITEDPKESIEPGSKDDENEKSQPSERSQSIPESTTSKVQRRRPSHQSTRFQLTRLFRPRDEDIPPTQSPATCQLHSQTYILRACRALISYGAPSHRMETYMQRTAEALNLHLQAFYLPNCMIISFDNDNDATRRSVDVQIITCEPALNLAKLSDVHRIYKDVIHRRTGAKEATERLDEVFERGEQYPRWVRVLMYGLASACIGPVSYGARPIDLPLIFLLGSLVGLLDLVVTAKSVLYGYIFEMSSAILVSFLARALGSIHFGAHNSHNFCFSAVAQASLVLILPGFTVTSSALELQSRMMISGAVRLVYGIIYTLFLAFGFLVGITVYGAIDRNATSATSCDKPWPFWWQVIFVLPFTFCYVVVNQAKWRQIPAMLVITLSGWLVNHFSAQRFPTIQSFPNALGALTVGILANLYSRLGRGLAIAVMHPAIFILVPGSFAASGSLVAGLTNANEVTRQTGAISGTGALDGYGKTSALYAGYAMVEIAIGITAGLSVAALLVYPIRKRTGGAGLFTY